MKRVLTGLALVAMIASPRIVLAQEAGPTIVIDGATVIPMNGAPAGVLRVVVEGGIIRALGRAESVAIPAGAVRVDAHGQFLVPGLVDAHVHLLDRSDLTLLLAHGVTSVLNMWGAPLHLQWRDQIARGTLVGPAIHTTGPQLKLEAHPAVDFERTVADAADARRLVQHQAALGYDFIKIWGSFEHPLYQEIMAAARQHGMRVTGHIPARVGLDGVLDAGQSSIAHLEEYYTKVFRRQLNADIGPAVERTAVAGVPVITTLVTYEALAASTAENLSPLLARPERALLDPVRAMLWEAPYNGLRAAQRVGSDSTWREALGFLQRVALALHRAGVPLLAGSDAGELTGLVPGADLHRELELLASAGLRPDEVLAMATRNPGTYLSVGEEQSFGVIQPGMRADLLLLDADPREDVRHLRGIRGVMAAGRWYPRAVLDSLLAEREDANRRAAALVERVMVAVANRDDPLDPELGVALARADVPEGPMLLLAFALASTGQMPHAASLLQAVSDAKPDSYLPHLMLGAALAGAGDHAAARAHLARVLDLTPGHDGATMLLQQLEAP
jgi:imidazolonepropionase-like amidohydrolase